MLVEQAAIFGADGAAHLLQIVLHVVEHADQHLAVLHFAVELGEHLIRIVDRRDRLVRPGIDHAGPSVGPIGDHDAELERAEAGARGGVVLQMTLDLLVDRDAAGPAGRRIRAALDVAGKQLDAGEQAADAAHVAIAVAADLVAHAVQHQRAILKRLERLEALLERELLPFFVRPECARHDAVGAEHDHHPLLPPRLIGERQARQIQDERQRSRADAKRAEKLAAGWRGDVHGCDPLM